MKREQEHSTMVLSNKVDNSLEKWKQQMNGEHFLRNGWFMDRISNEIKKTTEMENLAKRN